MSIRAHISRILFHKDDLEKLERLDFWPNSTELSNSEGSNSEFLLVNTTLHIDNPWYVRRQCFAILTMFSSYMVWELYHLLVKSKNYIVLRRTNFLLRPHLSMFIGVWGAPGQNKEADTNETLVTSIFWLKVHSTIYRPFLPATIYLLSSYNCHLGTSGNFFLSPQVV